MKIAILLLTPFIIFAQNFEQFLNKAVQSSPYLKSSSLSIKQVKEEGDILLRYKNPSLELEYSSFVPDIGSSDDGYRFNYSQPIRLWNVGNDKVALTKANIKVSDVSYMRTKAIFVRDISLLYTKYSQTKKLLTLGEEELRIAKNIYDISIARYESGSISEGLKLQAQVDFEMIEARQYKLALSSTNSYFTLLGFAGINEEIQLDEGYTFSIKNDLKNTQNPSLALYQAKQDKSLKESKLNSNSLEWINLFAELENEPQQDIIRVGVNLPLVIFNNKSQEKKISILQASQAELLVKNESKSLDMQLLRLQKERISLLELNLKSKEMLKTQKKLLKMYEDGYKIANTSLLQLQDIKNKLIKTRRQVIQTDIALDQNAIQTNYNKGNYNE